MKIEIFNLTNLKTRKISRLLKKVFKKIDNDLPMQIIYIDKVKSLEMNSYYKDKDYATDVLSFLSTEEDTLGDVFLCLEKAYEQANEYNHSIEREVSFLAVHGYLHLMGYNHNGLEEEKIMMDKTEEILKLVKLSKGDIL